MEKKKAKEDKALARQKSGVLSKQTTYKTIGELERDLLKKFPAADAEAWDHTGLLVGDPAVGVRGVAVALDPTVEAVKLAHEVGANVLVTHHPAFLEAPASFMPADSVAHSPGAGVWAAIELGVALMCFHTTLDVSTEAAHVLPGMLNLQYKGVAIPLEGSKKKGYGQVCAVRPSDVLNLEQLAARCTSVFGRQVRVWGDFSRELKTVITCTGSSGDLSERALAVHADCLVCGEIRYHDALAASQAGLSIIDIGHDTSELPLVAVLVATLEAVGFPKESMSVIDQGNNWSHPETVRM